MTCPIRLLSGLGRPRVMSWKWWLAPSILLRFHPLRLDDFRCSSTQTDICPYRRPQIWPLHALWRVGERREALPGDVEPAGAAHGWGGQWRAGRRSGSPQLPGREPLVSGLCRSGISPSPLPAGGRDSGLNMVFSWQLGMICTWGEFWSLLGFCLLRSALNLKAREGEGCWFHE